MRVQYQSFRPRIKTGIMGFRDYWSDKKQRHNTNFVPPQLLGEVADVNETLVRLESRIQSAIAIRPQTELAKEWLEEEVEKIVHPEKFESKAEVPKTLMAAVDDFIEKSETRIVERTGKHIGKTTRYQYLQMKRQLISYLRCLKLPDIALENVNKAFYDGFVDHLYRQGFKLNTIGKHIKNVKAAINALPLAQRATCEFVEPKKCVKLAEEVDNIYLTESELEAIATLPLDTQYLDRVRDQFILLSWTGCRYSDLGKLNKSNIITKNGREYFKIEQQKTGARPTIPILHPVRAILEKYDYNVPRPVSNQKFNLFIKQVAKMAGLTDEVTITRTEMAEVPGKRKRVKQAAKRVTQRYEKWQCVSAHTARRSFASNMYVRGIPTLAIMAVTGHRTEKAFLSYIKVTQDENAERMLQQYEEQEAHRMSNEN